MNGTIILRPAVRKDIVAIRELQSEDVLNADGEPWSVSHYSKIVKDGFLLVAELNKKVIGYACGERMLHDGAMFWFRIVNKKFRGQGIGTALADYFEQVLRDNGIKWFVSYAKPNVAEFHKKRGAFTGETYVEVVKDLE